MSATWTRLDANFPDHPMAAGLTDKAFRKLFRALTGHGPSSPLLERIRAERLFERVTEPNGYGALRKRAKRLRAAVIERDGMNCGICGTAIEHRSDLHIDHIIPVSRGGSSEMDNLQPAHGTCNMRKGAAL